MKQVVAVIDSRTTIVCLNAAGQIKPVEQPFTTLNGDYQAPPFHINCRAIAIPFAVGAVNTQRSDANAELLRRPKDQRDPRKMKMPPKPRTKRRLTPPKRKPAGLKPKPSKQTRRRARRRR